MSKSHTMKAPRTIRVGLVREVVVMAFDTVRTNKMRSGLTVLGVVIGITSIVGMTALIRGFDQSLRDMIRTIGPNTIFVQRFGITSFASGREFSELIKRPNLTISDARALEEQATTLQYVDIELGVGAGPITQQRVFYRDLKTRPQLVFGTTEFFAEGTRIPVVAGRFLNGTEVQFRANSVVLGNTAYQLLFADRGIDPIGKTVRVGTEQFTVVGVFDKRPSPGNFNVNAGRLRRHPLHDVPARLRHPHRADRARRPMQAFQISVLPAIPASTRPPPSPTSSASCASATA